LYRKGQTVTIHYVFRIPVPEDYQGQDFNVALEGDVWMAGFMTGDVFPFTSKPLFHDPRGNRAGFFEGIAFDHRGARFPWQSAA